ncbi:hypothetical protein B0H67DRAFT_598219 [Lasiosphaeris hirsuta]|uniref:Uncharacterized protein n=1 Tax=Lasiosphaeris hirsuta TaxID=260670 RepID=A0AA40E1Q7_9PEZI|nr:hypothetical protein B0H67DRAFT_598219 [Lasiosphaeris hirsuta]
MTEPDHGRPGSSAAGYHTSSIPPSPRPSVVSRASRSSLRREKDRHDVVAHGPLASAAHSHSHSRPESPHVHQASLDEPIRSPSPPPQPGQPVFAPLFALLTSSTPPSHRQTTHHPTLHYIFADDNPELLTAALARHHHSGAETEGGSNSERRNMPRERAVILDLVRTANGAGLEVAWASSLSPDWAVVSARVSRMEGVDGAQPTSRGDSPAALMLTIEGVSVESSSAGSLTSAKAPTPEAELQSSGASGARQPQPLPAMEEYANLLSDFERRMAVLRQVVEAGGERQRVQLGGGEGYEEGGHGHGPVGKDEMND